jgi:hypothetical protein
MIREIELRPLMSKGDMVPQAILNCPVEQFMKAWKFVEDHDTLDYFTGAAFSLDDRYEFALIHHRGDRENTTTVYLPDTVNDVGTITTVVKAIVDDLGLPQKVIRWQRADGVNV